MLLNWPAPERNKVPILEVLQRLLPQTGTLLEIASGTGQHAVFFAQALPGWRYLPSDIDPANLSSIQAHREQAGLPNLAAPRALDVCERDWHMEPLDAVFSANMIHIAPWACCEGLLRGAAAHTREGGKLILYGPFRIAGEHTSESNGAFDADLRRRDARWGVRDLESVTELGLGLGFQLSEVVAMPANNQCVCFERR